jgi:hypothetical protein
VRDNLRLYRKMLTAMKEFLPGRRITRLRNLAFLASGLFLAESVHLGKMVRKWPFAGKVALRRQGGEPDQPSASLSEKW